MTIALMSGPDLIAMRAAGVQLGRQRRLSTVAAQAILNRATNEEVPLLRPPFPVEVTLGRIAKKNGVGVRSQDGAALVPHLRFRTPRELKRTLREHGIGSVVIFDEQGFAQAEIEPRVRIGSGREVSPRRLMASRRKPAIAMRA